MGNGDNSSMDVEEVGTRGNPPRVTNPNPNPNPNQP